MNEYVLIGKLVNTHGIKGEVKILSNFEYKERVFKKDFKLYLGNNYEEKVISSYRYHQIFDNEYLYSDLINKNIVEDNIILGKVTEIVYNNTNILLKCLGSKVFYIPLKSDYIIKVGKDIETQRVRELML